MVVWEVEMENVLTSLTKSHPRGTQVSPLNESAALVYSAETNE